MVVGAPIPIAVVGRTIGELSNEIVFTRGDGNKDPAMLTFIYKTGFKNSVNGTAYKPPRKNSKAAKQSAGLCSYTTDKENSTCSYHSDDTGRGW